MPPLQGFRDRFAILGALGYERKAPVVGHAATVPATKPMQRRFSVENYISVAAARECELDRDAGQVPQICEEALRLVVEVGKPVLPLVFESQVIETMDRQSCRAIYHTCLKDDVGVEPGHAALLACHGGYFRQVVREPGFAAQLFPGDLVLEGASLFSRHPDGERAYDHDDFVHEQRAEAGFHYELGGGRVLAGRMGVHIAVVQRQAKTLGAFDDNHGAGVEKFVLGGHP